MILTVTSNIALDRTYVVDRLEAGAVHKVRLAFAQTGGKGVNVSRNVAELGGATVVSGLVGAGGLELAELELRAAGLDCALYEVAGETRQTVTVTASDGTTTAFDEAGPTVTDTEWCSFEEHVRGLLDRASMLVLAGSLPPGAPDEALQHLVAAATDREVAVIVDSRGNAMRAALAAGPLVAKLNRAELSETLGRSFGTDDEVVEGARELRDLGAHNVIVTLGAGGAIGLGSDEIWKVAHPPAAGNPIGAGDAFTAAAAMTLAAGRPFPEALLEGAAAGVASLRSPTAGHVEAADVRAAALQVEIHEYGKATTRA
jgi:tagatose 6-phosphate kinase